MQRLFWVREELICAGHVAVPDTTLSILFHIKYGPQLCLQVSWVGAKRRGREGRREERRRRYEKGENGRV